jgi:hypothetical protein
MAQVACLLIQTYTSLTKTPHTLKLSPPPYFDFRNPAQHWQITEKNGRTDEDPSVPNEIPPFACDGHKTYNLSIPTNILGIFG